METASTAQDNAQHEESVRQAEAHTQGALSDWHNYAQSGRIDPQFLSAFKQHVSESEQTGHAKQDALNRANLHLQSQQRIQAERDSQSSSVADELRVVRRQMRRRDEEERLDALQILRTKPRRGA
jgi:hypothetical protein